MRQGKGDTVRRVGSFRRNRLGAFRVSVGWRQRDHAVRRRCRHLPDEAGAGLFQLVVQRETVQMGADDQEIGAGVGEQGEGSPSSRAARSIPT